MKNNKIKVVFIAGSSHSGSTLLDKVIGSHPNGISLGEIYLTYKRFKDKPEQFDNQKCSCGVNGSNCLFWQKIFTIWTEKNAKSYNQAYSLLLDHFITVYGKQAFLIDSSKYLPAIQEIQNMNSIELHIIHLIKDVRSYIVSQIDRAKQKGTYRRFANLKHTRSWYNQNKKIQDYLRSKSMNYINLSYEELCMFSQLAFNDICDFINEHQVPQLLKLDNLNSHLLTGNNMRLDPKKSVIQYDFRWFNRRDWIMPYFLWKKVRNYNMQVVYSRNYHKIFEMSKIKE